MHFNVGDEVEAKFMGIDKKSKVVNLSIKAKDQEDEAAAMKGYTQAASSAMPTLGDIFKEQMENK
jgi:small subunit ribosomal protein S1